MKYFSKNFNNVVCIGLTVLIGSIFGSCESSKKEQAEESAVVPEVVLDVPDFNADSAYTFIEAQLAFGPRVPGTPEHGNTAEFLVDKFKSYGAQVQVQEFEAVTFDNVEVTLKNIIASFNKENKKRVLLGAHWDTRPFADKDIDRPYDPMVGANDGASGVAVLLEIARILGKEEFKGLGVDIILFDGEDWGNNTNVHGEIPLPDGLDSWYCLGSQYWSKNKHEPGYSAYYGILLDMVGAKNSQFHMEGESMRYAPSIVNKVWTRAQKLGYTSYFIRSKKPGITDDHIFVNEYAKIPMINVVHYDPAHGYFGDYHHTHNDNLDLISRETLDAVGETVLHVLYYEQEGI